MKKLFFKKQLVSFQYQLFKRAPRRFLVITQQASQTTQTSVNYLPGFSFLIISINLSKAKLSP